MTTTKAMTGSARNPSSWDPQDDVLLRHLKEVKKLGWKEIAQYFQSRTPNACQFRWRRLKSGSLKTGTRAEEEEEGLLQAAFAREGKFVKPRAASFNSTALGPRESARAADEENIGLIPKIVIRSRRGSVVQQSQAQAAAGAPPSLVAALNTTFANSKARKDSFSSRTRRSSFQLDRRLSVTQLSATPTRRSSLVAAPTSVSALFPGRRESFNTNTSSATSRRSSAVYVPRRGSFSHNFTDLPRHGHFLQHGAAAPMPAALQQPWSEEEDRLLQARQEHRLSLDELSILLPHRSDEEIQWRIDSISPVVNAAVTMSPSASPFRAARERSFNEDTAIEEDEDDRHDEFKDRTPVDYNHSSNLSSASSAKKEQRQSPIFFNKSKETSPTTSDGTTRSNTIVPPQAAEGKALNFSTVNTHTAHVGPEVKLQSVSTGDEYHNLLIHHNHHHPQAAATPLPSLNSIFKNVL
ncbi:AaceriACR237Cp [[Ashbya] aceris (nom. inval.)]|nr:AaceriACR237Cp [[Ashbya] aceris (nom. inval.)]